MINVKKVRPMFNYIVTTADRYEGEVNNSGIITKAASSGEMKELQKVIAVGSAVKGISVGDMVCIDPRRYAVLKYEEGSIKAGEAKMNSVIGYRFNFITLDGEDYLMLTDGDIMYVAEDYEEIKPSTIVTEKDVRGLIV